MKSRNAAVLFDIGSGSAGKLRLAVDYTDLDAILITHMHADHFFDLVPLRYALKYGERRADRLPLWLPPGGCDALDALRRAVSVDAPADFFDGIFAVREYEPSEPIMVKDIQLHLRRTRHYVQAYAVRAECCETSLTYSADTAPSDDVVDFARSSSLFLCEAALGLGSEEGERGHSSAWEAGEMAHQARVRRLLLTHYPARDSAQSLVEAAQSRYEGAVSAADDGIKLDI
ncbi:MAG: MBL fold metallo-hydrolase [Candidatus Eremiobacteraeota bacterium]|nr:MBL fold metallo-hydrolase [Candidatus Eremiobacteraeota bacterium]